MNILLIGMPGSGKTTIGKMLADKLQREFIDVDGFILAKTGKDSAEHLTELGDADFLQFEAELVKKIQVKNAVIAASGSVPLVPSGIEYLKKNAFIIWLKPSLDILKKHVNERTDGATRIVGLQTKTFEEIWEWRTQEYQKHHHAILEIDTGMSAEIAVNRLLKSIPTGNIS